MTVSPASRRRRNTGTATWTSEPGETLPGGANRRADRTKRPRAMPKRLPWRRLQAAQQEGGEPRRAVARPAGLRGRGIGSLSQAIDRARSGLAERRRRSQESSAGTGPVRIASFGGQPCVHGLSWWSRPPPLLSGPRAACSWRGMHATSDDRLTAGLPPLMAVAALAAEKSLTGRDDWDGTAILAVDDPREKLRWAGVMSNGQPSHAAELLFSDRDGLISWLQAECSSFGIDRLIAIGEFGDDLHASVNTLRIKVEDVRPDYSQPEFRRRILPPLVRALAAAGAVAAAAAAGWMAWLEFRKSIAVDEAAQLAAFEVELAGLAAGCAGELSEFWPRPPGWEVDATGCIAPGMYDETAGGVPAGGGAAYRTFTLKQQHNAVLARAVAELLYEDWDGEAETGNDTIILRRGFPVEPVRADEGLRRPGSRELAEAIPTHFLGLATAVTVDRQSTTIRSRAAIPTLLEQLIELDRRMPLSLRHLSRRSGEVMIEVVPRQHIMKPAFGGQT